MVLPSFMNTAVLSPSPARRAEAASTLPLFASFCGKECSRQVIDETSVKAAIELAEYFRCMEQKVYRHIGQAAESDKDRLLFDMLPDEFKTAEAYVIGANMGKSKSTMKRFLAKRHVLGMLEKTAHGCYRKVHENEEMTP